MSQNTILSDINEIQTGFFLAGQVWYDAQAKKQFDDRVKQAKPEEIEGAIGKAKVMAAEFLKWAKASGYSGQIQKVWWTARPGSMSAAVGKDVDQRKNPTDILVKFSSGPHDGFLGLSAKATKTKGDIGFKNPGVGTLDKNLNTNFAAEYKTILNKTISTLDLPENTDQRKKYIRDNSGIKKITEDIANKMMSSMRDKLIKKLSSFNNSDLVNYLLEDWMDAKQIFPPYIKVTGQGNSEPYTAVAMDPTDNEKLNALNKSKIKLEKIGNETIGVKAGDKRIMKIRFKFESEKMASSLKLSGDPW
jgi:hypothetical protein